jgi:hypothetical protein
MAFMNEAALADLAANRGSRVGAEQPVALVAHAAAEQRLLPGISEFLRFYRCGHGTLVVDTLYQAETTLAAEDLHLRLARYRFVLLVVTPQSAGQPAVQGFARMVSRPGRAPRSLCLPVGPSVEEGPWAQPGTLAELPFLAYRAEDGARAWQVVAAGGTLQRWQDWLEQVR